MDKRLWNEATKELKPYVPGEQPAKAYIKLNTNENPYPPSPRLEKILKEFDLASLAKYPNPQGKTLRQAIADKFELDEDMVFVGNGSDEVLYFAFKAFFGKDRPVAFADITYSFYEVYARSLDIDYELIELAEDLTIPVQEYINYPGGLILANPNAPTGLLTELSDIQAMARTNKDRLVLVDEAYIDFGGKSAVELLKDYDNILVVRTLSKSASLAGIRVGYAMGSKSLIAALDNVKDTINSYTLDSVAQALAVEAIKDGEWLEENARKICETREHFMAELDSLGFKSLESKANFVFTSHPTLQASFIYEELKAENILVRYFNTDKIDNYLRITIGRDEEMDILLDKLRKLIENSGEEK